MSEAAARVKRRPSGWLRLWVVVVAFYGLVAAFYVSQAWPSADSGIRTYTESKSATGTPFSFDFYGEPTDAERDEVRRIQQSRRATEGGRRNESGKKATEDDEWVDVDPVVQSVELEGRPSVFFPTSTPVDEMTRAVMRHVNGPWPERRKVVRDALVWWTGPMLLLFALGWAIGWVVRGFRGEGN